KKKKTFSKWQTLMNFPNSLFMIEQSLRTRDIRGQQIDVNNYIPQAEIIYNLILVGERIRSDFNDQRYALSARDNLSTTEFDDSHYSIENLFDFNDFDNNDVDEYFKDNLDELLVDDSFYKSSNDKMDSNKLKINISNFFNIPLDLKKININKDDLDKFIKLIEIQQDSYIEAEIFPKNYHCWNCSHFMLLDSTYRGDLKCPCCKEKLMEQEALIFICPICASIIPIHPWWERDISSIYNQEIKCPNSSCSGHIHLFLDTNDLMKSNWVCNECKTNFINHSQIFGKYKERRLILYCNKCGVYSKNKENSLRIPMKLKPTTARLYDPLRLELITINDKPLSKNNLKENLIDLKNKKNSLYWNLEDSDDLKHLITNKFAIENIFLVQNIKTFNAVFGYQSALPNNQGINPIPNFFKFNNKYTVYFFEHIGNGLAIELNKKSIIKNFSRLNIKNNSSYDQLIYTLIEKLKSEKIQVLLNDNKSNEIILLKALHTFIHILLQNLFKKIGLESFRCKILLRDGIILLYEIEDISTGGLFQLTLKSNFRIELLEYLLDCEKNLKTCIHDCEDFCKQCSFIDDYYCKPFIFEEINRWIPSNAFLSRKISRNLILLD
ncbi:MAG: hypothetical protein ACTSVV_11235, partial [Promethearchaeota archaeon]